MKIGITYDTPEMYDLKSNRIYFDFAEQTSINEIKSSLSRIGYKVDLIGNADNVLKLIKSNNFDYDLIYNTVEGIGSRNREGLVPAILEAYNVPYIGTDSFGLSLTLDKRLCKVLAREVGVLTPDYFYVKTTASYNEIKNGLKELHMPIIIKPNFEGNSSGICVKDNIDDAIISIKDIIAKYNMGVICETFIRGREVTVPLIGNSDLIFAVTTVDIQTNDDFWLDVNCKVYGDYHNILLDRPELSNKFYNICKTLFNTIDCKDFARFDFRIDSNDNIYFIEANPLPALFKGGSFDLLGQSKGLNYDEMLQLIINTTRQRLCI